MTATAASPAKATAASPAKATAAPARAALAPLAPGASVLGDASPPGSWPTPRRLRLWLLALLACSALLFVAGEGTLAREHAALKTLGRDTAPSIIAAQQIRANLADLDASVASTLIGTTEHRAEASRQAEQRRAALVNHLVDAAHNITYESERGPTVALLDGLGRYFEQVALTRQAYDSGDEPRSRQAYRAAIDLLHGSLLPAADALDRANRQHLDRVYDEQRRVGEHAHLAALLVGLLLLGALLGAQATLITSTRRMLNPALLAATTLAAAATIFLASTLDAAQHSLRSAKEDAFESIHLLFAARSVAYDLNGDESRFLFDRERAPAHEASFQTKVALLTTRPVLSPSELGRLGSGAVPFQGMFARELSNITYPGERDAAIAMVKAFSDYMTADAEIRRRAAAGDLASATALCLGTGERESNGIFARFDASLSRTLTINEEAFKHLIERGDERLRFAAELMPLLALACAALAFVGLRPRLREFD